MTTYTRQSLKHDKLIDATKTGVYWFDEHRKAVIVAAVVLVVVVAAVIGGFAFYQNREEKAQVLFGQAMKTYQAPLKEAAQEQPTAGETYNTAIDRSKAANSKFAAAANQYGYTPAGRNAKYFAALTAIDLGQTADAEKQLNDLGDSRDKDVGALAKLALASLYRTSGRGNLAIPIYQGLIQKPTNTVPASMAKLQLADLYQTTNPVEAKKLYAQLKDQDKGEAGQIASQKLGGK